jgi:hypothetical protein
VCYSSQLICCLLNLFYSLVRTLKKRYAFIDLLWKPSSGKLEAGAEERHRGGKENFCVADQSPATFGRGLAAGGERASAVNLGTEMSVVSGDYVFSDPIAFRHLAQEEGTETVEEHAVIEGYQVYIVEQWACSRVHPVFVVTTFTGEESNKASPFYASF